MFHDIVRDLCLFRSLPDIFLAVLEMREIYWQPYTGRTNIITFSWLRFLGARELLTKPGQSKEDIGVAKTMVAGSCGGIVFWSTTYPFDVIKSRVQVDSKLSGGLIATLLHIARNEGVSVLYSGLTPTLVRTIPATAVLFLTYEYTKKFLHYIFWRLYYYIYYYIILFWLLFTFRLS